MQMGGGNKKMMKNVNKILEVGIRYTKGTDSAGQGKWKPTPGMGRRVYQHNSKPAGAVGPCRGLRIEDTDCL